MPSAYIPSRWWVPYPACALSLKTPKINCRRSCLCNNSHVRGYVNVQINPGSHQFAGVPSDQTRRLLLPQKLPAHPPLPGVIGQGPFLLCHLLYSLSSLMFSLDWIWPPERLSKQLALKFSIMGSSQTSTASCHWLIPSFLQACSYPVGIPRSIFQGA